MTSAPVRWWVQAIGELAIAAWLDEGHRAGYDVLYVETDPRAFQDTHPAGLCILARGNGPAEDRPEHRPTLVELRFVLANWPEHLRETPQRLVLVGPLMTARLPGL